MQNLQSTILQWIVVGFLALVGIVIVYKMLRGNIDLDALINEPDGKASLSRFQLLLFTFAIVGIYVALCFQEGEFIEIPNGVLGLLGISGGSYVLSKGIQMQGGNGAPKCPPQTSTQTPTQSSSQSSQHPVTS
jgi:hypothetical protein